MKKVKTNVQLVKNIMETSHFGVLSQAFVMEAIGRYAEKISEMSVEDFSENSFIDPGSWIGVAKEIKEKLSI